MYIQEVVPPQRRPIRHISNEYNKRLHREKPYYSDEFLLLLSNLFEDNSVGRLSGS